MYYTTIQVSQGTSSFTGDNSGPKQKTTGAPLFRILFNVYSYPKEEEKLAAFTTRHLQEMSTVTILAKITL